MTWQTIAVGEVMKRTFAAAIFWRRRRLHGMRMVR